MVMMEEVMYDSWRREFPFSPKEGRGSAQDLELVTKEYVKHLSQEPANVATPAPALPR